MAQRISDFSAAALAYVRHVLHQTKMSPTGLARRAKISSTTLTRALNDRKHKFALSVKTLEKIYEVSGINPAKFLNEISQDKLSTAIDVLGVSLSAPAGVSLSAPAKHFTSVGPVPRRHSEEGDPTIIVGTVAAGRWRESTILDGILFDSVTLRHSDYPPSKCFVCLVGDDSVNRTARKGELLYCIRLDALKQPPEDQAIVILERRSEDGHAAELTARRISKYKNGWVLTFSSSNKHLKEVIEISDLFAPKLRIIGLVEYVFRRILPRSAIRKN
jgi:transcriptional regulator with XRE-family HTH domain